jgi:glycosyltransferase involved in cell wall biosynthesis
MLLPFAVFETYGGMQSHVYSLSEQLALMGHDVFLIGENFHVDKVEVINGVKRIGIATDPLAYRNYFSNFRAMMNMATKIKKIHAKEKFDVFHAHGAGGALMAIKSKSNQNKLIITSHGLPISYLTKNSHFYHDFKSELRKFFVEKILEKLGVYLYNQAHHIIAVSKHVANAVHIAYRVDWEKITIIPNGICPEKFFRQPALKNELIGANDPLVLFVGMLDRGSHEKGLHFLIEAFANVHKRLPNAKLLVVGGYNQENYYFKRILHLCKKFNIDSSVIFTGHLPHQNVKRCYAAADVFVLPSIYEGLPVTLLEAMASSLPVIASKGPYLPTSELIKDGVTGLSYEVGDVNQLSEAIFHLLNDRKLAEKMGKNAREYVKKYFDWRIIAKKTLRVYNSA